MENITRQELKTPPGLMVKLDGAAESAAGDILADNNRRYFLLEFKASITRFYTELKKPVFDLIANASLPESDQEYLLELSKRGHFLVYPDITGTPSPAFAALHRLSLRCVPYHQITQRISNQILHEGSSELSAVFYQHDGGLSLTDIAYYLSILANAAEDRGEGGVPFKAVLASPDGYFLPIGSLSEFMEFVQIIEQAMEHQQAEEIKPHQKTTWSRGPGMG